MGARGHLAPGSLKIVQVPCKTLWTKGYYRTDSSVVKSHPIFGWTFVKIGGWDYTRILGIRNTERRQRLPVRAHNSHCIMGKCRHLFAAKYEFNTWAHFILYKKSIKRLHTPAHSNIVIYTQYRSIFCIMIACRILWSTIQIIKYNSCVHFQWYFWWWCRLMGSKGGLATAIAWRRTYCEYREFLECLPVW